ncbi:hypothetical protein Q604_UNBC17722G0001, partial [human gut metagenome]
VMSAPNNLNPLRCKSIGLLPILHPPGNDNLQYPNLASIGPIIRNDALIFLISSALASIATIFFVSIANLLVIFDILISQLS